MFLYWISVDDIVWDDNGNTKECSYLGFDAYCA